MLIDSLLMKIYVKSHFLDKINLEGDHNFDEDDPETIIHF